jgi:hypothetical protein
MTYWSYALRYAAHVDQFLSSHDGQPEPYSFWHPDLPINPTFHAFGAPLIYRQQEPNLQRKLDPRGHRARYLGPAEQHGCVYVLDLDLAATPIRITNNVLRRTYREPLVVDIKAGVIIDPAMMDFDLVYKSDGTTGIEHVLAEYKPIPVPPAELEQARKHQEFCAKRAQQLHDQGVGAFEAMGRVRPSGGGQSDGQSHLPHGGRAVRNGSYAVLEQQDHSGVHDHGIREPSSNEMPATDRARNPRPSHAYGSTTH